MKHAFNLAFKMNLRKLLVVALVATMGTFSIFLANNNDEETLALANNEVTIGHHPESYTEWPAIGAWSSPFFTVQNQSQGFSTTGTCVDPGIDPPAIGDYEGTFVDDTNDSAKQKIKLALFLYNYNGSINSIKQAKNTIFGDDAVSVNDKFARLYVISGLLNHMDYTPPSQYADLNTHINYLQSLIDSNSDAWIVAKNYRLYIGGGNGTTSQRIMWIREFTQFGSVEVQKCDKGTNTCSPQNGASFSGITFGIYNVAGGKFYNPRTDKIYSNGDLIAEGTTNANGYLKFDNLLANNIRYEIRESSTNNSYQLTASNQQAYLTDPDQKISLKFYNDIKRGDVKFIKKDSTSNTTMSNVSFRISALDSNNQVIESHIVITDNNGEVDTSKNQHSNHTNGYDSGQVTTYSGYGTWFGLDKDGHQATVDNSLGALPYGRYRIQELECTANQLCYDINNQSKTFTVESNKQVVDLGNWTNECASFDISTTATDSDGDKFVAADANATIVDKIHYCAKKGETYTITGVLMDKTTGTEVKINGNSITKTISLTVPTTGDGCGDINMTFPAFNATTLAGKEIVVFETLNQGNNPVAEHKDLNNAAQTVTVVSLGTTASDKKDGDKYIEADSAITVKDVVNYCVKPGSTYTISGILIDKKAKQPLLINNKEITATTTIKPTTPCGSTTLEFNLDASKIAGKDLVVFETLKLDNKTIITHEDINDTSQTVTIIDLSTTATNAETGEKLLPVDSNVKIKDLVSYCLKPNQEYTLKGILMNKKTGEALEIDEKTVRSELTFTPKEACGEVEMTFSLNTTDLDETELVVFEDVYLDEELIINHHDIDDDAQTVRVDIPAPNTGHIVASSNGASESANAVLIITIAATTIIVGYISIRLFSRSKILNRK